MTLLEVPSAYLLSWGGLWMPYAQKIARREGLDLSELVGEALSGEARIFAIFGADGKSAGACATRLLLRNGKTPIGELHWLAGDRMSEWLPSCFPRLEQILIRDHGVTAFKTTVRPGLERAFRPYGYRRTKVVLHKRLNDGR